MPQDHVPRPKVETRSLPLAAGSVGSAASEVGVLVDEVEVEVERRRRRSRATDCGIGEQEKGRNCVAFESRLEEREGIMRQRERR